jgi:CubicO group peptidase (beta-lactamase class C family)
MIAFVIASAAKQTSRQRRFWIASSLSLLAMTTVSACATTAPPLAPASPARVALAFDQRGEHGAWADGLADPTTGRRVTPDDPVRIASVSEARLAAAQPGVSRPADHAPLIAVAHQLGARP